MGRVFIGIVACACALCACAAITGIADYDLDDSAQSDAALGGEASTTTTVSDDGSATAIDQNAPKLDAASDGPPNPLDASSDAGGDAAGDGGGDASGNSDSGPLTLPSPTPGEINCNVQICNSDTQRCCYPSKATAQCQSHGAGSCTGSEINCDEKKDCKDSSASFCCLERDDSAANNTWSTYCRAQCNVLDGKHATVCKSDNECIIAQCKPIACGDRTIGTCNGLKIPECL